LEQAEESLLSVEEVVPDAELVALEAQVKGLQNSLQRLEAMMKIEELKPEPKEITKGEEETGKSKSGREK